LVVAEECNRLGGDRTGELKVLGRTDDRHGEFGIWAELGRIKRAEAEAYAQNASEGLIDIRLREQTAFHGAEEVVFVFGQFMSNVRSLEVENLEVSAAGPDHVSAYALVVEEGTALARKVRRGELPEPDDDLLADRYVQADETLSRNGYGWYEVSNWARGTAARSRHNHLYWTGGDWWGVGPGAHSHVGGVRWWNVRHPAPYAAKLHAGESPAAGRELLDPAARRMEATMLGLRLREGLPVRELSARAREAAGDAVGYGLLDRRAHDDGRAVLTLRGRLLADAVARDLTD